MKRLFIPVLVLGLAACGSDEGGSPARIEADASADATAPAASPAESNGVAVLAEAGLTPPFQYGVNYDIVDRDRSGRSRRRVLLEVLDGDLDSATRAMNELLASQDYVEAKASMDQGKLEQVFRKKGSPTLVLLTQPAAGGPELKDPAAVGSIHVMWNIPPDQSQD